MTTAAGSKTWNAVRFWVLNPDSGWKTIHFWWTLTLANIKDLERPPEKISKAQSSVLAATGLIWTRYSYWDIFPKNVPLAACNFFLFLSSSMQLGRRVVYDFQNPILDDDDWDDELEIPEAKALPEDSPTA